MASSYKIHDEVVTMPVVVRDASAGTAIFEIDAVAAQALLGQLGLAGHLVTLDALHCQRKPSKPAQLPRST